MNRNTMTFSKTTPITIIVRIIGDRFAIIGPDHLVSDEELVQMAEGVTPEGWTRSE